MSFSNSKTCAVTHVIDFGPGLDAASMSARNLDGWGVQVIAGGALRGTPYVKYEFF